MNRKEWNKVARMLGRRYNGKVKEIIQEVYGDTSERMERTFKVWQSAGSQRAEEKSGEAKQPRETGDRS